MINGNLWYVIKTFKKERDQIKSTSKMKTILVPTNFSNYSTNALVTAASMTRAKGGRIVLMHNVETLLTNWPRLAEIERMESSGNQKSGRQSFS